MQEKNISIVKNILNALRNHYKFRTYGELASFLGVKQNTLSTWISRGSLDRNLIYRKCDGIRFEWLERGEGDMFVAEGEPSYNVTTIHRALTPEEERLLEILNVFPDVREAMEAFIQLPPRKQKIYLGKLLEEVERLQEDGDLTPPCVMS